MHRQYGAPMARQLAAPPFELTVYDVSAVAMEPFRGKASLAESYEVAPDFKDITFSPGGPKAWFAVIRRG